jgi:hypothetical protein
MTVITYCFLDQNIKKKTDIKSNLIFAAEPELFSN